ncbi:MAG: glycosyl hydrolase [Bacteroidetes bacterium]|nr:glycosyl hydrolase [Bacteroidota bacterium]
MLLCSGGIFAQTYIAGQLMPSDNFYEIKDYINTHLRKTTGMTHNEEESEGDHLYDRWINYWQYHVNPDGTFPAADYTYQEMKRYHQAHPAPANRSTGHAANWHQLPVQYGPDAPGIGRVDRISFNDHNANHLYLSTPSGSFWESHDRGTTWTPRTDTLPVIGLAGIVVDPNDTNIIYLATGDGEANSDNPSVGVLKSYDAGSSWHRTGLSFTFTAGQKYISRLEMDPTDPSHLLVAASNGVYRTMDSGTTWTSVRSGNFRDVKYMPLNGAVCYAVTNTVFSRSIDSGRTWVSVQIGNPGTSNRMTLAVSPAAPANVYILSGGPTGLVGVYMSTDTGKTWTTQATSPNLFSYDPAGSDQFSQSWYTCAFAVSPTDPNLLFAGGANVWSSTDAGVTWNCETTEFGSGFPIVHVDIHELHFSNDGTMLYIGCDGGLYAHDLSTPDWNYLSEGLQNTQIYRIAVSDADTTMVMYGAQDNDVVVDHNGTWDGINLNADGFGCAIDPTNPRVLFGASQYGGICRSDDRGGSWQYLNVGAQNADWDAPYKLNIHNSNELFAGLDYMYETSNGGASWNQLGALGSSNNYFTAFDYCETNTQIMYATYTATNGAGLFKSTDGGRTWANLNNHDISGLAITSIAVHPDDPDQVWIAIGGYRAGKKVYYTNDGGTTFYNISGSLPNLPAHTIIYQKNSNEVIYVGMDNGVYVNGDTLPDWTSFADNLPNAIVKELKIRYSTNELFAGTYGRGIWRTKLYQQSDHGVGVQDVSETPRLSVYPNPVTDDLTIETKNAPKEEASISITSAAGILVKELQTTDARSTVPCADMAPGIYFVTYQANGCKTVRKFVKI